MLEGFDAFASEPLKMDAVYDYEFDGVVVVTPYEEFRAIEWNRLGREAGAVVIDGRDALDIAGTEHRVYTIGRS